MLYVIGGASGSGKTTVLPFLQQARPDVSWHDFDERHTGGGKRGRQQVAETWIRTALATAGKFGLLGQCPLGEMLAAPSAAGLGGFKHLLLDVGDIERIRRLRRRGDGLDTQDVLNWAAWMRVHEHLPDWRPDVLSDDGWEEMRWERWAGQSGMSWPGQTLDTTGLTPEQTAARIVAWLDERAG